LVFTVIGAHAQKHCATIAIHKTPLRACLKSHLAANRRVIRPIIATRMMASLLSVNAS